MHLLAIDTGTETLSIGVSVCHAGTEQIWTHEGPAGAAASASLVPAILALLAQAGVALTALDAIVFGAGPGSFTGLRTACAVAQGLGFGAGIPLLPVDSLLAVAEDARHRAWSTQPACTVTAVLDARMDEVYVGTYYFGQGQWSVLAPPQLTHPQLLELPPTTRSVQDGPWHLAGNAFGTYAEAFARSLAGGDAKNAVPAAPTAQALLRLAPQLLGSGAAVPAAQALPVYIRDKVAKTTLERNAEKSASGSVKPIGATVSTP